MILPVEANGFASEESNIQSTDTSSQQTSEPTSEVETDPVRWSTEPSSEQNLHLSPIWIFVPYFRRRVPWSTSYP